MIRKRYILKDIDYLKINKHNIHRIFPNYLNSKSFKTQISSPKFVELHLKHSVSNDSNRLLVLRDHTDNGRIRCLNLDNPICSPVIYFPLPEYSYANYCTVGSCNGLVLVKVFLQMKWFLGFKLMLFNPCMGVSLNIPDIHDGELIKFFGFGYDSSTQDYKIVGFVYSNNSIHNNSIHIGFNVWVFSLKANSWKLTDKHSYFSQFSLLNRRENNGVLINDHLLHWVLYSYEMNRVIIGCFDLRSEQWVKYIPLPDYRDDIRNRLTFELFESQRNLKDDVKDLGVLDGCLCVLTEIPNKGCVDVWVMKEYGIKESWVKIFGYSDSIVTKSMNYCPLAYRGIEKNEILVLKADDDYLRERTEFLWYNIKDKAYVKIAEAEVGGVDACICHGSLLVLPNSKKIDS